ncbi:MAG: adenylosuccinate synthase [Deltaproteobacteria bacterium]|nr:adenylosuccinate synthase [Deltaproteobacteria bacterium]
MPVLAVVGAQWGDEGKGRVVDWLARRADVVVRFQGGDNAGHTVVNEHGLFKLHMVPSGIFRPEVSCIIGAGCVVHPQALLGELAELQAQGIDTGNLWIDERAHLVMPWHLLLDGIEESGRSARDQIGTTRRGIGPCYTDKAARRGIRAGDLLRPELLRARVTAAARWHDIMLRHFGQPEIDVEAVLARCAAEAEALGGRIVDTTLRLEQAQDGGATILLEGQLGVMRDLEWGIYPFVTSSSPTAAYAPAGSGLGAGAVDEAIGVVKAYSTSVGGGPFPTELLDATGERLRSIGGEFGATTGRPRRCGWLDAVALRYAVRRNGLSSLVLTKLDVLDDFAEIAVAEAYSLDGARIDRVPTTDDQWRAEPVYEWLPGWQAPTKAVRTWDALPAAAQAYVRAVEAMAGVPISHVSVGPERDAILEVPR